MSRWAWEAVGAALASLEVDEKEIDRRGDTVRFALVEGFPTFITVEPAGSGLDLFGHVRIEVTSIAGDGVEFDDVAEELLRLNTTVALGRWLWFADGAVGRSSAVTGTPETLSFLPRLLPDLARLSAADAVRANRNTDGVWSPPAPPSGGGWSQSDSVQWLYTLIGHPTEAVPLSQIARREDEFFHQVGEDLWYSAGGEFSIAETVFADFGHEGENPGIEPVMLARFGSEDAPNTPTVLARFTNVVENPAYGKGSMVGLELPSPLPESYGWPGYQVLHSLSVGQPLLELGAWTIAFEERGPFPKYASFVPSAFVAGLGESEEEALADAMVRDALAQVRAAARAYEAMETQPAGEDLRAFVAGRVREHRVASDKLLRGGRAAPNVGAGAVAFLADDMLQIDREWSTRRFHEITWLPHHQMQVIAADCAGGSPGRAPGMLKLDTTVASASSAGEETWTRINDFNAASCLASLVRLEDGSVNLLTSCVVDQENAWWLQQWLADLAVLHVAVSKDLAEAAAGGRIAGWEASPYELSELGMRPEPDRIIEAIEVLYEHSTATRTEFQSELYEAIEATMSPQVSEMNSTGRVSEAQAPSNQRDAVKPRFLLEFAAARGLDRYVAELEEVDHSYLGPSLRLTVKPESPESTTVEAAATFNRALWGSDTGLLMPIVCDSDGAAVSSTVMAGCLTRGLATDQRAGLIVNLILAGSRSLRSALERPAG